MTKGSIFLTAALVAACAADVASAQTASRVIRVRAGPRSGPASQHWLVGSRSDPTQRCANCHRTTAAADRAPDVEGAPEMATLRQMAPETILQAITKGAMRVHADDVPDEVKRAMAEFISGRKLAPLGAGDARNMPNRCSAGGARPATAFDPATGPLWNGWSPDPTNARFQRAPGFAPQRAGVRVGGPAWAAADVPRLTLKWAFGFPGVSSVYGQPTVAGGRVFVGVDTGYVYALDAATGCVHWSFLAETGVRNAVSIGPASAEASAGQARARHAAFFGDIRGNVYAVDADTGELLWKVNADPHPLATITGAPTLYEGRLYVPVSSREEAAGGSLKTIRAARSAAASSRWKPRPGARSGRPTRFPIRRSRRVATRRGRSSGRAPAPRSGTRRRSIRAIAPSTSPPATRTRSRRTGTPMR